MNHSGDFMQLFFHITHNIFLELFALIKIFKQTIK